ncbi:hypothetical protein ACJIZ3_014442 [Penstemon smallii]|uniref:Secreted protein n=1 Tax=Penstemon smallii TaxID=265156 RepID=A0ABD3RJJ4_9LAMI
MLIGSRSPKTEQIFWVLVLCCFSVNMRRFGQLELDPAMSCSAFRGRGPDPVEKLCFWYRAVGRIQVHAEPFKMMTFWRHSNNVAFISRGRKAH